MLENSDQDAVKMQIDIINSEIRQLDLYVNNQKEFLLTGLKIYLGLLAALVAYASFIDQLINAKHLYLQGLIGTGFTIIVFACGWVVLSYSGNSVSRQLMTKKQIAYLRKHLTLLLIELSGRTIISFAPNDPMHIPDPTKDRITHYVFALLNISILLLCLRFTPYIWSDENLIHGFMILLFAIIFMVYPNLCARITRRLYVARKAKSAEDEMFLWNRSEKISKMWGRRQRQWEVVIYLAFLALLFSIASIIFPVRIRLINISILKVVSLILLGMIFIIRIGLYWSRELSLRRMTK